MGEEGNDLLEAWAGRERDGVSSGIHIYTSHRSKLELLTKGGESKPFPGTPFPPIDATLDLVVAADICLR